MTTLARGQAARAGAGTPASPRMACVQPGCPAPAVHRGACAKHSRTTSQRGYGTAHQLERQAALPGAKCEACGCTRQLQRDHRDPSLRGPMREHPLNKRWMCDCPEHRCHSRLGLRRGRVHARSQA